MFTSPKGKSLLVECHSLGNQIVRGLLLPTFIIVSDSPQKKGYASRYCYWAVGILLC